MAISRIQLGITVSSPVSAATVVVPVSAVSWINIVIGAEVDYLGRNPVVREISLVTDATNWNLGKAVKDIARSTDAYASLFSAPKADASTVGDKAILGPGKGLADTSAVGDKTNRQFGKGLTDTSTVGDGLSRQVNFRRALDEYSTVGDKTIHQVGKVSKDSARSTDDLARVVAYHRTYTEASTATDATNRQFGKSLQDSLTVTDDIDGVASIEDDQEMQLGKTVTDIAQLSDNLSRQVNFRRALDEYAIDYFLDGFAETNTARVTDALARVVVYHRAYTEASTATDATSRGAGKVLTHAAAFADSIALQAAFQRAYSDTSRTTDAVSNGLGKGIGAYALDYFGQDFVDNHAVGATDVLSRSIGAVRADSARISATGLLTWQSFGADYFQGDYVGAAQTF